MKGSLRYVLPSQPGISKKDALMIVIQAHTEFNSNFLLVIRPHFINKTIRPVLAISINFSDFVLRFAQLDKYF